MNICKICEALVPIEFSCISLCFQAFTTRRRKAFLSFLLNAVVRQTFHRLVRRLRLTRITQQLSRHKSRNLILLLQSFNIEISNLQYNRWSRRGKMSHFSSFSFSMYKAKSRELKIPRSLFGVSLSTTKRCLTLFCFITSAAASTGE